MDPIHDHGAAAGTAPSMPIRLVPSRSGRPWGGGRFGSVAGSPVGELWISGDEATLPDGLTLAEAGLASRLPLVKILDIAGTLSVQVHPDDETARTMFGPAAVGKHECWVVLEAAPGSSVPVGLSPEASIEDLFSADETRIGAALRRRPVVPGSIIDIAPGTVHAPSAGLVLYEIQQRSDLTFRIWDWGRPRQLHVDEARRVIRPANDPLVSALPVAPGVAPVGDPGAPFRLRSCVVTASAPVELVTDEPGVLSVLGGPLRVGAAQGAVTSGGESLETGSHWLLPAGRWRLGGAARALLATW